MARAIRKRGVVVHHRPHVKLRQLLVAPKDPTPPLDKSGVIYQISCHDWPSGYVGETERPLRLRVKEHKSESSPVGKHAKEHQHAVDFQNVKVLEREERWLERGIK